MKYKYEFNALNDFEPGNCHECPLSYEEYFEDEYDSGWDCHCVLACHYEECPLQVVE